MPLPTALLCSSPLCLYCEHTLRKAIQSPHEVAGMEIPIGLCRFVVNIDTRAIEVRYGCQHSRVLAIAGENVSLGPRGTRTTAGRSLRRLIYLKGFIQYLSQTSLF